MIWKHILTNIDSTGMTADCANCGRVGVRLIKHRGVVRCREAIKAEQRKYKIKNIYNGMSNGVERPKNCEVCGSTKRISYDHDHLTGKHRGWLCGNCNAALGMVKDNKQTLQGLIEYLS